MKRKISQEELSYLNANFKELVNNGFRSTNDILRELPGICLSVFGDENFFNKKELLSLVQKVQQMALVQDNDDTNHEREIDIINVWKKLTKMGYSKGDIVISDDYLKAIKLAKVVLFGDEDGDDEIIDEIMDEIQSKYDVSIFPPEDVEGDGPGDYVVIENSDIEDSYDDDDYNIDPDLYYDVIANLTPEMMKDDILLHVSNGNVLVIGDCCDGPVLDLDAYQSNSKYWTSDKAYNVWDKLMDILDKASQLGKFALISKDTLKDIIEDVDIDGKFELFDEPITFDEYFQNK